MPTPRLPQLRQVSEGVFFSYVPCDTLPDMLRQIQCALELKREVPAEILAADSPTEHSYGFIVCWNFEGHGPMGREEAYHFLIHTTKVRFPNVYVPPHIREAFSSGPGRLVLLEAFRSGTFRTGVGAELFPEFPESKPKSVWELLSEDD